MFMTGFNVRSDSVADLHQCHSLFGKSAKLRLGLFDEMNRNDMSIASCTENDIARINCALLNLLTATVLIENCSRQRHYTVHDFLIRSRIFREIKSACRNSFRWKPREEISIVHTRGEQNDIDCHWRDVNKRWSPLNAVTIIASWPDPFRSSAHRCWRPLKNGKPNFIIAVRRGERLRASIVESNQEKNDRMRVGRRRSLSTRSKHISPVEANTDWRRFDAFPIALPFCRS